MDFTFQPRCWFQACFGLIPIFWGMTPLWTHLFFDLGDCQPPAFGNVASLKLPSTCYPVWITAIDIVSLPWKVLSRSSDSLLHTTSKMNRSQAVKNGYQLNPSLFCGLLMQASLLDFLACPLKTQHQFQRFGSTQHFSSNDRRKTKKVPDVFPVGLAITSDFFLR